MQRNRTPLLLAILCGAALALVACSDENNGDNGQQQDSGPPEASIVDKTVPQPDVTPPPDKAVDQAPPGEAAAPDITADVGPPPDKGPDLFPHTDAAQAPGGTHCLAPNKTTLVPGGTKTINGTTTGAANEFGTQIKCGTGYNFDGAQVYYQVTLEANKTYKIQITATGWDPALYLHWDKTCTPASINTQCTGLVADNAKTGKAETLYVKPTKTRDYILAVDTYSATNTGAFVLTIEDFTPVANSICGSATSVAFTGTKVTVNGDTSKNSLNEYGKDISCGGSSSLEGPQLYYKVALTGAKAYRLTLKPSFAAFMYVFPASLCGIGPVIDTACKSLGKTGAFSGSVGAATTKELIFKPATSTDYLVAIDSASMADGGSFVLDIEEAKIPAHDSCATAKTVTLGGGKAVVQDNTKLSDNKITLKATGCTTTETKGADLFFAVTVTGGKTYKVTLKPEAGYDPALYVFTACSSVASTCITGADAGYSGTTEVVKFTAAATATYLIGVDSRHAPGSAYSQGTFSLTVEEYTKPSNDSCKTPKTMAWSGTKATVIGDTFYSKDEYPTVTCGGTLKFDGPQLYYKVALIGGKKYLATLTPASSYDASLYAFPSTTSCSAAAVSAACKGSHADSGAKGASESIMLSPGSSGDWTVVADSWDSKSFGTFTLDVTELAKPGNDTCASAQVLSFPTGASQLTASGYTFASTNNISLKATDCTKSTTGGPDVFYQIKLEQGKTYKFKLDGTGYNESLYLFTSCTYVSSTCAAGMGADASTSKPEELTITPTATLNYYVAIDGRNSTDAGAYTLTVDRILLACDVVKKLTFSSSGVATGTGDTATGTNTVDMPSTAACAGTATPGYEHIYSAELTAGQPYTFKVTPSSGYDPVVYIFSDCSKPTTSCIKGGNVVGQGKTETLSFTPTTKGTYYFAVDSASALEYGPYILELK